MKYVSTRKGIEATAPETVFQGLAPDGGLYVPVIESGSVGHEGTGRDDFSTLAKAEDFVLSRLFGVGRRNIKGGEKEVDNERHDGKNVCRPDAKTLGGDVHQQEHQPGENNAAIQGKPSRARIDAFVGKQVHRHHRRHEKSCDQGRNASE